MPSFRGFLVSLWVLFLITSTLAWKIPWTEEPGRLQSTGSKKSDTTERLHFHLSLSCIGEGNGNPLQCSCLENPRNRRAWWADIYGVTQSRTQLKWLSSSSITLKLWQMLHFLQERFYFCLWQAVRVEVNLHLIWDWGNLDGVSVSMRTGGFPSFLMLGLFPVGPYS